MFLRRAARYIAVMTDVTQGRQDRLIAAMRAYGGAYTELTRRFAGSLGLHSTDANALVEIIYAEDEGKPLSPATLSAKLGLSRPATSALLNRLEAERHVVRTHEQTDRRVVTLRCRPGIQQPVIAFFTPMSIAVAKVLESYSDGTLDEVERFIAEFSGAILASLPPPGYNSTLK